MLLAFDTATPQVTVALHDGASVVAESRTVVPMRHGESLVPLIDDVLRDSGVSRRDLDGVAVGVGPGPYTGLRVGLVTAQAIAHALGIPLHGVCSLDVLAAEAAEVIGEPFRVATDARRREVFLASYDTDGRRLHGPVVVKPADAPGSGPVAGQGAELYPDDLGAPAGPLLPSAGWLARVVLAGSAEAMPVEPLYLRRPDATVPGAPKAVS